MAQRVPAHYPEGPGVKQQKHVLRFCPTPAKTSAGEGTCDVEHVGSQETGDRASTPASLTVSPPMGVSLKSWWSDSTEELRQSVDAPSVQ